MPRYRTEILISADRYICLQLPDDLPPGRAMVTVELLGSGLEILEPTALHDEDTDRDVDDVEWWDEFD